MALDGFVLSRAWVLSLVFGFSLSESAQLVLRHMTLAWS